VVVVSHHSYSRENCNFVHNLSLMVSWCPKVSNKCGILHFHHVHCLIKSLFFGQEHLVDVDGRNVIALLVIGIEFIEHHQLLFKRVLCLYINLSRVVNRFSNFRDHVIYFMHLWNLVSTSCERIANSKNFVSD